MKYPFSIVCLLGAVVVGTSACEKQETPRVAAPTPAATAPAVPAAPATLAPSPHQGLGAMVNPQMMPAGEPAKVAPDGGSLVVGGVHASIPKGWSSVPPANSMRLAELRYPDAEADVEKACTTTFVIAAGDVESNVARWAGQMAGADGNAPTYQIATKVIAGLNVSTVEMAGSFAGMGEGPVRSNWMLRGAIVEGPEGQVFIKMTGPADAMKAAGEGWTALVDSLKKAM